MKHNASRFVQILAAMTAVSAAWLWADTPGALHPRVPLDPRTTPTLIKQGEDAFNANDLPAARDAFSDACTADPASQTAARDLAITYLRLEKPAKAAHPLEVAASAKSLDRGLVLALAVHRISIHQPMQAVKFVSTYFDAHPTPPDEQLLNAMGVALAQADSANVKSSLFTEAQKNYKKLNTKLETTRTGEKRWGPDWLPAADVDTKQSTVNAANTTVTRNTAQIKKLDGQIADTQRQKDAVLYTEGNNNQTQKKDAFQKQIDEMNAQRTTAKNELDEAIKTLADLKPKWPDEVPIAELSLATTATADATAAMPSSDAKPALQPYHSTRYAAAFAIAPDLLVTASSAVADASDIQIATSTGQSTKAEIVRADSPSGLTLLRVTGAHFAPLPIGTAAKTGAAKCEAFPEVNLFTPSPLELSGTLGATGDHPIASLDKLPRLPGGPILQDGKVVGVEIGDRESDRENIPVVSLELLQPLLASDATGKAAVVDMKNSVFQIAASKE